MIHGKKYGGAMCKIRYEVALYCLCS